MEQTMTIEDDSDQTLVCVWDAVSDSPSEAANMRLRSELMIAVKQAVADWGLT
jgi:predicted XRE-type DNA-binding protein